MTLLFLLHSFLLFPRKESRQRPGKDFPLSSGKLLGELLVGSEVDCHPKSQVIQIIINRHDKERERERAWMIIFSRSLLKNVTNISREQQTSRFSSNLAGQFLMPQVEPRVYFYFNSERMWTGEEDDEENNSMRGGGGEGGGNLPLNSWKKEVGNGQGLK